jgi:hypothetical protein
MGHLGKKFSSDFKMGHLGKKISPDFKMSHLGKKPHGQKGQSRILSAEAVMVSVERQMVKVEKSEKREHQIEFAITNVLRDQCDQIGRCYDQNFLRFLLIFDEKIGVFLQKPMLRLKFCII